MLISQRHLGTSLKLKSIESSVLEAFAFANYGSLNWWWWSIAQLKNFFKFWLRWCWFVQHVLHIDFLSWVTFIRFHWLLSSNYQRLSVWEIREMISWTYSDRFLPRSDGLWISGHYTWMIHSKTIPGRHFVEKLFVHFLFFEQQRIQIHFSGDSQTFCICFDCFYSFGAVSIKYQF